MDYPVYAIGKAIRLHFCRTGDRRIIFAGVTEGHDAYIINLNCSKFEIRRRVVFHPYRFINGSSEVKPDYCIECRCDKVHIA